MVYASILHGGATFFVRDTIQVHDSATEKAEMQMFHTKAPVNQTDQSDALAFAGSKEMQILAKTGKNKHTAIAKPATAKRSAVNHPPATAGGKAEIQITIQNKQELAMANRGGDMAKHQPIQKSLSQMTKEAEHHLHMMRQDNSKLHKDIGDVLIAQVDQVEKGLDDSISSMLSSPETDGDKMLESALQSLQPPKEPAPLKLQLPGAVPVTIRVCNNAPATPSEPASEIDTPVHAASMECSIVGVSAVRQFAMYESRWVARPSKATLSAFFPNVDITLLTSKK